MSDYCVICGDTTKQDSAMEHLPGEYVQFESSKYGFEIERWICYDCLSPIE